MRQFLTAVLTVLLLAAAASPAAAEAVLAVGGTPGLRFDLDCRVIFPSDREGRPEETEQVHHRLTVPRRIRLVVEAADCRIAVQDLQGRLTVDFRLPDGRHLALVTRTPMARVVARTDGPWGPARLARVGGAVVRPGEPFPDGRRPPPRGPVPPLDGGPLPPPLHGGPLPPLGNPLPPLGPAAPSRP